MNGRPDRDGAAVRQGAALSEAADRPVFADEIVGLNATFAIEDPAGVRPRMFFQRVPEPKSVKNRVHLDLATPAADSSDRAEEIDAFVERLTALGAHRLRAVKEDGYFPVMADPEGNEFCVD
jgi:hypothetical protein